MTHRQTDMCCSVHMHDTQTDRHVLQCSYAWHTDRQTCATVFICMTQTDRQTCAAVFICMTHRQTDMCCSVHMHDTQTDRQTDRHVLQCSYAWHTVRQTDMWCSVHMHDTQTDRQTCAAVFICMTHRQTDRQTCAAVFICMTDTQTDRHVLQCSVEQAKRERDRFYLLKWMLCLLWPEPVSTLWVQMNRTFSFWLHMNNKEYFYKKQPSTLLLTYSYICRPLSFWSCGSALCMFIKYRLKVTASVETIQH